jgi:hypothetical protein
VVWRGRRGPYAVRSSSFVVVGAVVVVVDDILKSFGPMFQLVNC